MSGEKLNLPMPTIRRQIGQVGSRPDCKEKGLRVYIPLSVYHKMAALTMVAESETSAMGFVHLEHNGKPSTIGQEIWVDELCFVNNTSSTAATTLHPDDLSKVMIEQMRQGKDMMYFRLWFHTHYNFDVFWSGTDRHASSKTLENSRWTLSIVMNQRQELRACVDVYRPDHHWYDEVPIYLVMDCPTSKWKRWCRQAKSKINSEQLIHGNMGDLSQEFIEKLRSQGRVVTRDDAKNNRAEVTAGNDSEDVIHHYCTCQKTLEVPSACKSFKCPHCGQEWDLNWKNKDAGGTKGEPDSKEDSFVADEFYKKALMAANHLDMEGDPIELNSLYVMDLHQNKEDPEYNPQAVEMWKEELLDPCQYVTGDVISKWLQRLSYLGHWGHLRVYRSYDNEEFWCTDDHPTLSTLMKCRFVSTTEISQYPKRFVAVRDFNNTLIHFSKQCESLWYDLLRGYFVSSYSKNDDAAEFLEDMNERRIKNLIGATLKERQEGGSKQSKPWQPTVPTPPAPRRLVQSGRGGAYVGLAYSGMAKGDRSWQDWMETRETSPHRREETPQTVSLQNVKLRLDPDNLDPA